MSVLLENQSFETETPKLFMAEIIEAVEAVDTAGGSAVFDACAEEFCLAKAG